jgi:serine/threonine protein kinase
MDFLQNLIQKEPSLIPNTPYQIIGQLNWHVSGERTIYLAKIPKSGRTVLLHRFSVSHIPAQSSIINVLAAEINSLLNLKHSGILPYLDAFVACEGFWLVQEYKKATTLKSIFNQISTSEVKQIALSILETLAYLQSRKPAVIHQAIKPENIVVKGKKVYLINFRLSLESLSGTERYFLAPEQSCNRSVTVATDLYALGLTLIYLLAKTEQIKNLFDCHNRLQFQHLIPTDLSLPLIEWLYTMVQPNRYERYPNAVIALQVLERIEWKRLPEVRGIPKTLELKATRPQEVITRRFIITNEIPDTILKGRWRVGWHPNDPHSLPENHAWISFRPTSFEGNQVECQVTINTKLLRLNQTYHRRLLLQTNTASKLYTVSLQVHAAKLTSKQLPIGSLLRLLVVSAVVGWLGHSVLGSGWLMPGGAAIGIGLGWTAGWGAEFSRSDLMMNALRTSASLSGLLVGVWGLFAGYSDGGFSGYLCSSILSGFFLGFVTGWIGCSVAINVIKSHLKQKFSRFFALAIAISCSSFGITLGLGLQVGFIHPLIRSTLSFTALPLALMVVSPLLTHAISSCRYCLSQQHLIKS